jgi:multimeric flavodoxin WrbA
MKALVLSGSRNPNGQTARAIDAVVAGLRHNGAACEVVYLPTCNLERCRQCDDQGWGTCRTDGRCQVGDDFEPLVERIRQADVVVFATPVYWGDLAESLRAFTDRLRRICFNDAGKRQITNKPAIALCVAGGGGGGGPSCCVSMERVLRVCGFDLVDAIPVRRQNLAMKLPVLQLTGQWLATAPTSN